MKETDVLVIGAGGAGLCAALAAAEAGVKVVVLDKANAVGAGATTFAGVVFGVESRFQKEEGWDVTCRDVFEDFMDYTHWNANARLVRAFIWKSASTIDWLMGHGISFKRPPATSGKFTTAHFIPGSGRSHGGATLVRTLAEKAEALGVEFLCGHRAVRLITENGQVRGAVAEHGGEEVGIAARAVIIATGGYIYNKEMVAENDGFAVDENLVVLHNFRNLTGDGLNMAWAAGAKKDCRGLHAAGFTIPNPGICTAAPWICFNQLKAIVEQPYLWLNQDGRRFLREDVTKNSPYATNSIFRQKDKCAYIVFDGAMKRRLETTGVTFFNPLFPARVIDDLDGQIKTAREAGNRDLFMAESLEDLAKQTGIVYENMKASIEAYNGMCKNGRDDEFGKAAEYLDPVTEPTFYAFRLRANAYGTIGGIAINEFAEALDSSDNVIRGLYAAGADACGIYGNHPVYYKKLEGGTLAFALNSGRIAGESAAKSCG